MALFGASPASAKPTMSTAGWCRADFTFSVREASFSASRQGVPEARFEGIFSTPLIADERDRDFRERGHWRAGIKDVRVSRAVFIEPPRDGEVGHLGRSPGGRAPKRNDVDVNDRGLIYFVDRVVGFDIAEPRRQPDVCTACAAVSRRSFIGHSGLAQTDEKSGFEQGADLRHPER